MLIPKTAILAALLFAAVFVPARLEAADQYAGITSGYIFLQVEDKGQAWYVHPLDRKRYYLGRPEDAFAVMKKLSLGAKHDFIMGTDSFPARLSGRILLDAEARGEAYYIYPPDRKKYYLGRPDDAFRIMRELGRGITNADLAKIAVGDVNNVSLSLAESGHTVVLDVPFTSQAPGGDWSDQRLADGCEEASALMAVKWARGDRTMSVQEAADTIRDLSDYLLEKYGEYRDISAADTVELIYKDYFNYQKVALKKNVSQADIIAELEAGNLVVVPMDGRILNNPYYTPPGPEHHMLVVRGYDKDSDEFITNDPGTRRGELYRYDAGRFFAAIRDYPTGYREPIIKVEKDIIVVWK